MFSLSIFKWIKRHFIISSIVLVIVLASGYFYFSRPKPTFSYELSRRGSVIQEVSVTGNVKAAQNVDLAFEKTGRVVYIPVKVGDKVYPGEVLVSLDNSDLKAQLGQAEANVKAAEAKLDELKRGTRPEEIQIDEVKVNNADFALGDAQKSLVASLEDSYTKSEDAVRNKVDAFFSNPRGANPKLTFSLSNNQLELDLESQRLSIENILNIWNASLVGVSGASNLFLYVASANKNLGTIKDFLDLAALAVNSLAANSSFSQTTIDGYKSNVSTARTNVNTAVSNLSSANSSLTTAQSNLSLAKEELALDKAGSTPEQILSQEATVEGLQAAADNIRAQISKTIIYSPLNGIVTKQEAKIGEIVAPNSAVVSLISEAQFQIEAFVPEVDIAKIKLSDPANVTLDAYGEDVSFEAKVIKIDPAETVLEGVSTYKVTLEFAKEDERIRSGMTANLDISTDRRDDAIFILQRSVISKGDKKFVNILGSGDKVEEREIKTGLRGSDGNIEVTEGLKEGERVLLSTQTK